MDDLPGLIGQNLALIVLAVVILMAVASAVKIVPQSEKYVVERFGRLHSVLGPGINLTVPFLDRVAHRISVLERQLPTNSQDAITADNVLVQSNRAQLITRIRESLANVVDDWGIEVTRAEILDVNLDQATRAAMLQQLNAERARRAQVTEAEGKRRAVELAADGDLYAAEQLAKAKRVLADAEAYATAAIAEAISRNGLEAAQYQVALKQVEALADIGKGQGKQVVLVPAAALDAFTDAFGLLRGRSS